MWFISGAEIVFVFFIVLLVFGADRIPSIAKTLAKGMTQVRQATNDIKREIQKSVDFWIGSIRPSSVEAECCFSAAGLEIEDG